MQALIAKKLGRWGGRCMDAFGHGLNGVLCGFSVALKAKRPEYREGSLTSEVSPFVPLCEDRGRIAPHVTQRAFPPLKLRGGDAERARANAGVGLALALALSS